MIFIKTIIKYSKLITYFILIEILISFILGIFNLLNINSGITSIISFISNIILFFIISYINGKKTNKKGLIEGLIISLILVSILFTISLIFFIKSLSYKTLIYYLCLIIVSLIASTIGKNKKEV